MRSRGSTQKPYKYKQVTSNSLEPEAAYEDSRNSIIIDIDSLTPVTTPLTTGSPIPGSTLPNYSQINEGTGTSTHNSNQSIQSVRWVSEDEELKCDEESKLNTNELLYRSNSKIQDLFSLRTEHGGEYMCDYMDFCKLNLLLNDVILKKVKARHTFISCLDSEWNEYQGFSEETAFKISKYKAEKRAMMDILKFNEFIWINQQCLTDLIKKYDAISSRESKLSVIWEWKLNWKPHKILFTLIKQISNSYHDDNEEKLKGDGDGINNYSFDRKSTKFWISHENVFQVIGIIIQHLPIYVFGEKRDSPTVYQRISSVYFDNDEFKCYHERVGKEEGARCVRIRWYDQYQPINAGDKLFFERKIHHCGEPSLKERFKIKNAQIVPFIQGNGVMDRDDRDSKGNKKKKELQREIYEFMKEYRLKPQTRTVCKRISFQFNNSNALRISLDLNLMFQKEKDGLLDESKWFTPFERIFDDDVVQFSFDILEIKLSGQYVDDPPQWLSELMTSDLLLECYKFSKYGQSVHEFYPNKVNLIPRWVQDHDTVLKQKSVERINHNVQITSTLDNKDHKAHWLSSISMPTFSKKKDKSKKKKVAKKPVCPKVYFSNERTFLGWFQAAVFIGGSGLTIHSIDHKDIAGYLMLSVAVLVLLWAIMLYYKRNIKLLKGKLTGLHDFYGPSILVTVILFVFIYSLVNGKSTID